MQESTPERNIQGSTFYTRPYLVCLTRRSNFYSHCNPAKIHDAPAALDERSRTRTRCPDDHTAFFFSTAHSSSSSSSASTDQLECARPRGPIKRRFGLRPAQEQHLVRMRVNTHAEKAPRPSLSFSFPHSLHAPFRVYIYTCTYACTRSSRHDHLLNLLWQKDCDTRLSVSRAFFSLFRTTPLLPAAQAASEPRAQLYTLRSYRGPRFSLSSCCFCLFLRAAPAWPSARAPRTRTPPRFFIYPRTTHGPLK